MDCGLPLLAGVFQIRRESGEDYYFFLSLFLFCCPRRRVFEGGGVP